jgi:hypothetical protein
MTAADPARRPLVIASLISWVLPPVGAAMGVFIWLLIEALLKGVAISDILSILTPLAFAKAIVFNVPTTFLVWLPIHKGFKAMGWQKPWMYALGFALAPAALFLSLGTLLMGTVPHTVEEAWNGAVPLLAAGVGAGLTLFITLRPLGQDDRTQQAEPR